MSIVTQKQTHTVVVRYEGDVDEDCQLCGAVIKSGDLAERTIVDDDTTWCCRECSEADAEEEYAAFDCCGFKD